MNSPLAFPAGYSANRLPPSLASGVPATREDRADPAALLPRRLAGQMGTSLNTLAPASDYSPAAVAERVLTFVSQRLDAEGTDPQRREALLAQARDGVERGFAEARSLLDEMGRLSGRTAADIDDTYQRIQQGLDQLALPASAPMATPSGIQVSADYSRRVALLAESFDLTVTTRDGDRLRISLALASLSEQEQGRLAIGNDQGRATLDYQRGSIRQLGGFQVSVEGELDSSEMAALGKLLKQVEGLASQFYRGDLAGAFDRARDLRLDDGQLASLSLQLTQVRVREVTESYAMAAGSPASGVGNPLLSDYTRYLMDALSQWQAFSASDSGLLEQLLSGAFALDPRLTDAQLAQAGQLNRRLLAGLSVPANLPPAQPA